MTLYLCQVALKKKNQQERIKKKDYEIDILKKELAGKDRQIGDMRRKINFVQSPHGAALKVNRIKYGCFELKSSPESK